MTVVAARIRLLVCERTGCAGHGRETSTDDAEAEQPASDGDPAAEAEPDSIKHGSHTHAAGATALALGALGVVFGDIGTSPLYASGSRSSTRTWPRRG